MSQTTPKGQMNGKQGIWAVIAGALAALIHIFLQGKGIVPPSDGAINPGSTGVAAGAIAAAAFLQSGPKNTEEDGKEQD